MAEVIPPGMAKKECERQLIRNIAYAAKLFAQEDKIVLLEALSPGTKPDYFYSSQFQVMDILNKIESENLFLQFDIYHAQQVDGSLTAFISEHLSRIKHIQVASLPGCHEPDTGEVNYDYLEEKNYWQWIGCEYTPRQETESGTGVAT